MKIALFHNPKAGSAEFKITQLISQLEDAGYDVLYESIKEKGKEPFASQLIERLSLAETGRSVGLLLGELDNLSSSNLIVLGLYSKAHSMCNDTSTQQTEGEAVSG
jgi:hypothetical protein